jgi:hypothetical protein
MRARGHIEMAITALFDAHGPYTPLSAAWRWLGYPSLDAARKAHTRGLAPFPLQRLPHRRGVYIATVALAQWLESTLVVEADKAPAAVQEGTSVT